MTKQGNSVAPLAGRCHHHRQEEQLLGGGELALELVVLLGKSASGSKRAPGAEDYCGGGGAGQLHKQLRCSVAVVLALLALKRASAIIHSVQLWSFTATFHFFDSSSLLFTWPARRQIRISYRMVQSASSAMISSRS